MSRRLGELLVEEKLVSREQLKLALEEQRRSNERLGAILVRLGYIREDQLIGFLSKQYGVPSINLSQLDIDPSVLRIIPPNIAHKHEVIPIRKIGNTLTLAMTDPTNIFAIDDVTFLTGLNIIPVVATEGALKQTIEKYYDTSSSTLQEVMRGIEEDTLEVLEEDATGKVDIIELKSAVEEAPVVKLVNLILSDAIKRGASDIHLEPYEKQFRVRYRIDGVLHETMAPPKRLEAAIISRTKIMASLDIAERRLPQDGRIKLKYTNREIDLRVSSLPTIFGEKIVMRILDKGALTLDLNKLGFEPKSFEDFKKAITSPYGMVLVTGPTGSGKTTTLYSAISTINSPDTNIMTAEDPVEYNLKGVNQVHIKEDIGFTFAAVLRSFLRQDPDVILVGEIRDFDTAQIAIRAALTGHLVFSTLHTNDAPSTIARLLDMGIQPFLVASSVLLILAQRLARKICPDCKEQHQYPTGMLVDFGFTEEEAKKIVCYKGKGCTTCNYTGYKGRSAIYEVMSITPEIKSMILSGASTNEIRELAVSQGMITLRQSGIKKVIDGVCTIEEIVRVTFGD